MNRAKGKVVKVKVRYLNSGGRPPTIKKIPFPVGKKRHVSPPSTTCDLHLQGIETVGNFEGSSAPLEADTPTRPTYNNRKLEEVEAWKSLRGLLFEAAISTEAPASNTCILCLKVESHIIRCTDCGPCFLVCRTCYKSSHKQLLFHVPEIWKDSHFNRLYDEVVKLDGDHKCSQCYTRQLTVLDEKSRIHQTLVSFCRNENENVTLLKKGLWGATPIQPSVAYSTQLLDWLTALQLEGHLSTKAFVDSLLYLNQLTQSEVKAMYRLLVSDCISEFHFLRHKRRILPLSEERLQCPACPKHSGNLIVSMDANFGLVRKLNAGEGFNNEKMSSALFVNEKETDEFVDKYDDNSSGVSNCSTFKAGNKLRSKMKWAKLAVKGVFGVACRHEVPIHLLDMKHGERLAYPVLMLNKLVEKKPDSIKLHVLYDIACTLTSHLKRKKNLFLLEKTDLALPIFHAYGHKTSCQVLFSPRRKTDIGLSDGEGMERFWSYLRPFSWITKEMRPDNRRDLLAHASFHYGWKKISNMETTLHQRKKRAIATKQSAEDQLKEVLNTYNKTQNDVNLWKKEEEELVRKNLPKKNADLYTMQKKAIEREILLSMKRKYSDGQSISIKLARQLTRATVSITKCLNNYNLKNNESVVQLQDALNSRSSIYNDIIDKVTCDVHIPWSAKNTAIDAMCLIERADEEVGLIAQEFNSLIESLNYEHHNIVLFLGDLDEVKYNRLNSFEKGKVSVMANHLKQIEARVRKTSMYATTDFQDDAEELEFLFPDPASGYESEDDFYDD